MCNNPNVDLVNMNAYIKFVENMSVSSCKILYIQNCLNHWYPLYVYNCPSLNLQKCRAGQRSAVGNVSGNRCQSDCRSRGREFDSGRVPYFRGDWSWNNFYGHSPPFRWIIQEGLLSVTSESMCRKYWLTACSSLPRKKVWLCELTVPQWP